MGHARTVSDIAEPGEADSVRVRLEALDGVHNAAG